MIKDDWKKHGFPVSNKLFSANAIFVKYLLLTSLIDVGIIIHYVIIDYDTIYNMFVQLIIKNQYILHVHVLSPCIIVN